MCSDSEPPGYRRHATFQHLSDIACAQRCLEVADRLSRQSLPYADLARMAGLT